MDQQHFYKQYIRPHLKPNDRPYNRQLYNDTKDMLHRERKITNLQVQKWTYPDTNAFMTKNERIQNQRWKRK